MARNVSTKLKSALQVALARAAAAAKEQQAKTWASRLTVEAWETRPFGTGWLAEHPCGRVMQFREADGGIEVVSCSGLAYRLEPTREGWRCSCPTLTQFREEHGGCVHEVAWRAVEADARRRLVGAPGRRAA